ncbi:MAG: hypothetical protein F6J87_19480 [Spirulina sp. SIO3F2]|nr:hypothetical protein [Spirulina sp. SIO3F2]
MSSGSVLGEEAAPEVNTLSLSEPISCPTEVESLTQRLLADLPSYANRVQQRSRTLESTRSQTYVVLAGKAEFEPLPVYRDDPTTEQVFFTTLEQVFTEKGARSQQHFHWLFLTQTPNGWYMVTILTRFGSSNPSREPEPPREASNGVVGQAIQLWLRDCRAGTVR